MIPSIRKVCVMAFQNSLAICMMRFYKVKGTWKTHFEESSVISIQFNKFDRYKMLKNEISIKQIKCYTSLQPENSLPLTPKMKIMQIEKH